MAESLCYDRCWPISDMSQFDPKQTFALPIPGPSRRQEVPLVRVGVIGGLESVVDITCQPRRAVLLFESLL